jgi:hypothetical protein
MELQTTTEVVKIGKISFGPAPVTLPASQVSNLLPPPSLLVLSIQNNNNTDHQWVSGDQEAAGIRWKADGSIQLTKNGNYKVVSLMSNSNTNSSREQRRNKRKTNNIKKPNDSTAAESTEVSVISTTNDNENESSRSSSSDTDLEQKSDAERLLAAAQKRQAFRQAQYLCAVVGTLILNILFLQDPPNRMQNAKDFVINFASDIIAVGSVLIITDFLIARDAALEESKNQGLYGFVSEFASTLWNGVKEKERAVKNAVRKFKSGKKKKRRSMMTLSDDEKSCSSDD